MENKKIETIKIRIRVYTELLKLAIALAVALGIALVAISFKFPHDKRSIVLVIGLIFEILIVTAIFIMFRTINKLLKLLENG